MENRETVKKTIRDILKDHEIQDKDKLETLPEVLTGYFGGLLVQALTEYNVDDPEDGSVELFMNREFSGTKKT